MKVVTRTLIAAMVALGCLSNLTARADDAVANPMYTAWAKFKPGSSNTIAADMEMMQNKVHVDVIRTLVSVTDDQVVIEEKSVVTVMGHDHESPAITQTIKAKADKDQNKETGEQDVEAMGKTIKCKVYEAAAKPAVDGADKKKQVPGTNLENQKATVYTNAEIPGGIVKLDTVGRDGKTPITFVLTAMESK